MMLPCPAPLPGGDCTPAPTDKCGCAIGCETCTQAQPAVPAGCDGYGWMPDDGTGHDPTPCRPAGATPQQAMCVYGDHCMCDDGYVCEDTLNSGECGFGSGSTVHCVPAHTAPPPPTPSVGDGDRPCVAPCAPVSAPCPPPGSGVPCRAACWCPQGGGTEEPAAGEPAAEESVAEEPAAEGPAAEEPAAEEPAAEEPAAEESAAGDEAAEGAVPVAR
eukprot:COSAG03_NODE_6499_length_1051_cov_1.326681_1_plen_217_part_00